MSEIKSRLLGAVKVAIRAQDELRLTTLRLALADIKRVEVDERIGVDGAQALLTLDRMIRQRRDAQHQFSDVGHQGLAEVETAGIPVFQDFMSKPLDDHEVDALIKHSIVGNGAQGPQDMGKAMNLLRPQVQDRVDMAQVSQRLKTRLFSRNTAPA